MSKHLDHILAQGVIAGLLAPTESSPEHAARPWPLTLLTGIGAWFAAIPFAVLLYIVGGGERSFFLALLSTFVMFATGAVLRSRPALFLEQFALAGMVAGSLVMYFYIAENGSHATACLTMFAVFVSAAIFLPQTWLRVLLGAAIGVTGFFGLHGVLYSMMFLPAGKLLPVTGMAFAWCILAALSSKQSLPVRFRSSIEAVGLGMSTAIVCSPFWVNDSFFFVEVNGWLNRWSHDLPVVSLAEACTAVVITCASATYAAAKWTQLRSAWFVIVVAVVAIFSWCIPSLCVLALIGGVALISGRRSTAVLCTGMLVWWMGTLYFSLQWTLIDKALVLAAAGVVLALTTAFVSSGIPVKQAMPIMLTKLMFSKPKYGQALAFLGCAVFTLGIANVSIMQKQALANTGATLLVELKPVDPRSLMQGDYMRLSFAIGALQVPASVDQPGALVGTLDDHAVWTAQRVDDGTPLAAGEIRINLSGTPEHPVFVTDAWFFEEGEGHRWQAAKYGEFRVGPDGKAVLITLRGKNFENL
jgi:uncharacterized membrane-anchored protein